MIGEPDQALGPRPLPVMSDGDVLFMTQLSSDISHGVSGITAVRGLRTKKRKAAARQHQHGYAGDEPPVYFAAATAAGHKVHSHHRHSRGGGDSRDERTSSKRLHVRSSYLGPVHAVLTLVCVCVCVSDFQGR